MTTTTAAALDPTRLIIAALAGLVILLLLIIKFKVQAMISILVGAVAIGLIAGMPFADIISSVNEGIGSTLKGIALLVGLGSMFGSILEISGGAQTLAVTMVKKFGDKKAAWALGITGLVIAMPVFFDAGLIILIPLAFSLAKRTKRSSLFYAIPPAGRSGGRPCIYPAHTGARAGSYHAGCRPGLGYYGRYCVRYFCHDSGRSHMGDYLRKQVRYTGSGTHCQPGRILTNQSFQSSGQSWELF